MNTKKYKTTKIQKKHQKTKVTAYIEKGALKDIKRYGDISATVNTAVLNYTGQHYKIFLRNTIAEIGKQIALLLQWRDLGAIADEGEIDEHHLALLEIYKDIYFRFKSASVLRSRKNTKATEKPSTSS